jgi:hypothetical protein
MLATAAGVLASLVLAAPAAAFTPPELFVRQQTWDTHEETGPWISLAAAPAFNYLGGYEIGYRLQESPDQYERQNVALTITGVPDGTPTQPNNEPYCGTRAGTVGSIVPVAPELQFEGNGTYTVKVSIGASSGGPADCLGGPATSGAFSVDVHVDPLLTGEPLTFRADPLPYGSFVGVRASSSPPGGSPEVRCGLNGGIQPDGSIGGAAVVPETELAPTVGEDVFTRPGRWACFARGVGVGRNEAYDEVHFGTPWSGPLVVDVRSDFRRRAASVSKPRAKRPRFNITAEWPDLVQGGRARLTLYRLKGRCKLRKLGTYRGRFGAKRVRIRVRRPRKEGYYVGRLRFAGSAYVHAGTDPFALQLVVARGRFGYAGSGSFPRCD